MQIFDIAVVGGGPAGSAFAMGLDKRFSVALIDLKTGHGSFFRKPCGGLLSPDAQKILGELGLTVPESVFVPPQLFSVRTLDVRSGIVRRYRRMYLNVDRHGFDMWLRGLAEEKAVVYEGSKAVSVSRVCIEEKSVFEISFVRDGKRESIFARCVTGADGANSVVRKFLGKRLRTRRYIAIQQQFSSDRPDPFYSCVFDSSATDCYSWGLHKSDRFIFGGAYPVNGCREAFERQKNILTGYGFTFGEPVLTEGCMVLRPSGFSSFDTGKDGVFFIGEAGGFISPSSLEGISSAIITGTELASAFNSVKDFDLISVRKKYRRAVLPLKIKLTAKLLKCPFMYNPFLRKLVMASGVMGLRDSK